MDDVKPESTATETPVEAPTEQSPQPAESIPETPEVPEIPTQPTERTVPLSALAEERKKRQEAQRELAKLRTGNQMSQFDPSDLEQVMQNPFVQELILKDAKRELTDYTRDLLDQQSYSTVPEIVKKAILKNVRGFVNENTSDVETAKVDILEYVEALAAETQPQPVQKGFPVATTNLPSTETSTVNSNEVNKILNKPIDEWTDEEAAAVGDHAKKTLKK
jgi:hypothetical protein